MKSFLPKDPGQNRAWFLVDAENQILGRLASRVAELLRGKQKRKVALSAYGNPDRP